MDFWDAGTYGFGHYILKSVIYIVKHIEIFNLMFELTL